MKSKEELDYIYGVAICGSGVGETGDKVKECYEIIKKDLEELEELKKLMGTPIQIEPIGYSIEKDTVGKNR